MTVLGVVLDLDVGEDDFFASVVYYINIKI